VFSASSSRIDTDQVPAVSTASWNRAIFSAQNSTSSGSSDTEVNADTVITCGVPSTQVPTTTMPVGRRPAALRNAAGATPVTGPAPDPAAAGPALPAPPAWAAPAARPGRRP